MGRLLLAIAALISSLAILLAGNSLQFVILSLRAEAEGLPVAVVGAMTTGCYVGDGLGTLQAPKLVDLIGHIRAFAALCSIISAVVLAHGLWVDPFFRVGLRFVTGLCFAGLATVAESWINAKATRQARGRLLATATLILLFSLGSAAAGPVVFEAISRSGPAGLFMVLSAVLLTFAEITAVRRVMREAPAEARPGTGVYATSAALAPFDASVAEDQLEFDFDTPAVETK